MRSHVDAASKSSSCREEGDALAGALDGDDCDASGPSGRALLGPSENGQSEAAGASGGSTEGDGRAGAGDADAVTLETFLDVLDAGASDSALADVPNASSGAVGDVGSAEVSFDVAGGLVAAAEGVLRAYRALPEAQLLTSGYLDLKGNAWGAIVWDGVGWVDIVTISMGKDGAAATVRVARNLPPL